jgi:hypothetical protein
MSKPHGPDIFGLHLAEDLLGRGMTTSHEKLPARSHQLEVLQSVTELMDSLPTNEMKHEVLSFIAATVPAAGRRVLAGIREMQGFLDAKRSTNVCITLCTEGFLHSRWSVEMTAFGGKYNCSTRQKRRASSPNSRGLRRLSLRERGRSGG